METHDQFLLKAKTRSELANEFGISRRTLYSWISKNKIILPKGMIQPKDLLEIYSKLGYPKIITSQNFPQFPNFAQKK